jgi:uncharacterized protein (TIGR03437 family)
MAQGDSDTRPALAYHASSYATGTIVLNGTTTAGDVLTIMIEDRLYGYTTQVTDSLADVRDAFVDLINANPNERVVATAGASSATNIRLRAKVAGPEGDGIPFSASVSANATTSLGPTNTMLCCANIAGAPLTADNPAVPGEQFYIFGTGLGPVIPEDAALATMTGTVYNGPVLNDPNAFVSSLAGGFTADVLSAGLQVGAIGVYQVFLELNTGVAANPAAQLTISQDIYTSNTVTIPIGNPAETSPLQPSAQEESKSSKSQVPKL